MGKILIVESDPVASAAMEDRLVVEGHRPVIVREPERIAAIAAEEHPDLLLLSLPRTDAEGREPVAALRQQGETRSLPVLVLARTDDQRERVAILRAGADDFLALPCDLDELALRVERLMGSRAFQMPVLEGNLESYPLWELMQYLQQSQKSGELILQTEVGGGRLVIYQGRVVAARWGDLPGGEALLATLGTRRGHFRFVAGESEAPAGDEPAIQGVLMQAAWLQDELDKRLRHLPPTGAPLQLTGRALPEARLGSELVDLPIEAVFQTIAQQPGCRLFDLIGQLPMARQKIRLAVAWLAEVDVVAVIDREAPGPLPNTQELASSAMVDLAVGAFLRAARAAGFTTTSLPLLMLVEPGNRPRLIELLRRVPGFEQRAGLKQLVEQLERERGGSATFDDELGKLSLHVQFLGLETRKRVEPIVSVCAGIFLWLDTFDDPETVASIATRLEKVRGPALGVAVVSDTERRAELERALAGSDRWQVTSHPPLSLFGVFRLLQSAWSPR